MEGGSTGPIGNVSGRCIGVGRAAFGYGLAVLFEQPGGFVGFRVRDFDADGERRVFLGHELFVSFWDYLRERRQPAARASASLQNQRSPLDSLMPVRS